MFFFIFNAWFHPGIRVRGHLGSGHFASVEKGVWISSNGTKDVAVKTLHRDAGDANRVKCLQEAAIMAQFHHPNIVLLHGIVIHPDNTVCNSYTLCKRACF